ncbi:MAG: hotdog fold thioesterase [Gemmatimonas sp.]|nr:hotdog fold thioesterase [Gemmatimonas sp.]
MTVDLEALAIRLRESNSFPNHLGMEIGEIESSRAVVHLDVRPIHLNGAGIVHGGVHASLMDTAMGVALLAQGLVAATSQMNVHYLAPVSSGRLVCVGEVVHRAGRTATVEAKLKGEAGELVAIAIASFRLFDHPLAVAKSSLET